MLANFGALLAAGSFVYIAQSILRGEDPLPAIRNPQRSSKQQWWNNVNQVMYEALDRSGAMGVFSEIPNLMERGGVGPSQLFGGEGLSRSRARPVSQMVFGPVAGKLDESMVAFNEGMKYLFTDQRMSPRGLRTMRRLLPFNNLLPLTLIADAGLGGIDAGAARKKWTRLKASGAGPNTMDLYYDNFMRAEHRLAEAMGIKIDWRNYRPKKFGAGMLGK